MNDANTPKVTVENRPRTAWLPVQLAGFSPLTPLQATHSTGSDKSTKADSVETRFKVEKSNRASAFTATLRRQFFSAAHFERVWQFACESIGLDG